MGGTNGPDATERELDLPATDTHGTEMNSMDTPPAAEFPFHEEVLVPATRTRRGGVANGATVCTREELAKCQREDRDVQAWKQRENPDNVVVEDGLLFRRWLPRGRRRHRVQTTSATKTIPKYCAANCSLHTTGRSSWT